MVNMKFVAFIPVRGGSKSIPLKNIKLLNGRPLVYWTIDAAVNCKYIDKVYVATDSSKIMDVVNHYDSDSYGKLEVISRSAETASDTASTESAMLEFAGNYDFENIVLIQATSPLLKSSDLDGAIEKYDNFDSMLSVVAQKRFYWNYNDDGSVSPINYDFKNRPMRQQFNGNLVENGAFYICSKEDLLKTKCRLSGKIGCQVMDEKSFYEIDEPSDWEIIEQLLKTTLKKKPNKIKLFLTDCDGCLTDDGMYYSTEGELLKKFNTRDGKGFELLKKHGILTGIITGENSAIVKKRAEKLKVDELYLGVHDKLAVLQELLHKYNLNANEVAYVGNDVNDIDILKACGLGFAPMNSDESVLNIADVKLHNYGGHGAVREAIDIILSKETPLK